MSTVASLPFIRQTNSFRRASRGTSRASAPRRASLQTVAADKNVLYDASLPFIRQTNSFRRASRGTSRASAPRRASLQTVAADKNVLYDVPVSNNGARCRLIIYWKQLEDEFTITNPSEVGGLKSEEYLAMNPQGKMPLLMTADGLALPESEVISQWNAGRCSRRC